MRQIPGFNTASGQRKRLGIPSIDQRDGLGDGFHPFGHHAKLAKER